MIKEIEANVNENKYVPKKFIIKITLLECRNLAIPSGDTPNPLIEIEVTFINKIGFRKIQLFKNNLWTNFPENF